MSTSEVFRPSGGQELLIRDNIAEGIRRSPELICPPRRPSTQGGYRFGQLSHHSFFTRHNPHPRRVRHIKGLLDVPICSVNDDGYFANPRYSLQFPPNSFNTTKMKKWDGRIPVNAININSQLHPINTITGLQYFTGLNSYPWRERAIPQVGLVPVTEGWRDELKRFTEQLEGCDLNEKETQPKEPERPRTTVYSPDTGRLIPPPSRALSRRSSRHAQRNFNNLHHIVAAPDLENVVLTMLCQILQTEDINAVQAWLCSSGDREKSMVMEMIKSALAGREEYWKQYPAMVMEEQDQNKLPPINGTSRPPTGEINRLVLEEETAAQVPEPPKSPLKTIAEEKDITTDHPCNQVFRPPSKKPSSQQASRPQTVSVPQTSKATEESGQNNAKPSSSDPRLKYSKSQHKDPAHETVEMWNPSESFNISKPNH